MIGDFAGEPHGFSLGLGRHGALPMLHLDGGLLGDRQFAVCWSGSPVVGLYWFDRHGCGPMGLPLRGRGVQDRLGVWSSGWWFSRVDRDGPHGATGEGAGPRSQHPGRARAGKHTSTLCRQKPDPPF